MVVLLEITPPPRSDTFGGGHAARGKNIEEPLSQLRRVPFFTGTS